MEQIVTQKELQKLINKKFPSNRHLFVIDKLLKGRVRPCICDTENRVLFYMSDHSSETSADISIFDTEDNERIHITETVVRTDSKEQQRLYPCCFHIEKDKKYTGTIKLTLISLAVELEGMTKNWSIQHSDRYSLGYSYKYSIFKQNTEAAHFRSKVLRQKPFYVLDYSDEQDQLFLITLFIIHSVYINKRTTKEIKKEDRLARTKGLLGL